VLPARRADTTTVIEAALLASADGRGYNRRAARAGRVRAVLGVLDRDVIDHRRPQPG
jgi:hypothetical protein